MIVPVGVCPYIVNVSDAPAYRITNRENPLFIFFCRREIPALDCLRHEPNDSNSFLRHFLAFVRVLERAVELHVYCDLQPLVSL